MSVGTLHHLTAFRRLTNVQRETISLPYCGRWLGFAYVRSIVQITLTKVTWMMSSFWGSRRDRHSLRLQPRLMRAFGLMALLARRIALRTETLFMPPQVG